MRATVAPMLAEVYPQFAKSVFGPSFRAPAGPARNPVTTRLRSSRTDRDYGSAACAAVQDDDKTLHLPPRHGLYAPAANEGNAQ